MSSDLSSNESMISLSDSIYSNSPIEESKRKGEVIDMSRNRDKTLTKTVLRNGRGWSSPMTGDEVSIHYVAKREDGTVFDSSRERDQVFTFTVGRKQVVKGLDIAIKTMKWSEISKFTFSEDFAFDENNCPPSVTPRALITYEVELFYFKLIDLSKRKDGSIKKRIIKPGVGPDLAIFGATCNVDVVGTYEGREFDRRSDISFTIGEAPEENLIEGIDIAVTKMRKQEVCRLFVKPKYAFGPKGNSDFAIPEDYKEVVFDITLNDFSEQKEPFEMFDKEKLETSEAIKTKANNYFNQSKYDLAHKQYKRMVRILRHDSSKEFGTQLRAEFDVSVEEFATERDKLLYIAYQNLSNCCLKLEDFSQSLKWIDLALKIDPTNSKGLYRRGKAYYCLEEYELAKSDFQKCLQSDPNNKSAHNLVIQCNNAIKSRTNREKNMFRKFFETEEQNTNESTIFSTQFFELKETGDVEDIDATHSDKNTENTENTENSENVQ